MKKFFLIFVLLTGVVSEIFSSELLLMDACADYEKSLAEKGELKKELLSSAIGKFESQLKAYPRSSYLHYNLGTAYLNSENYARSILHLKKALLLNTNDQRVVNNLQRAGRLAKIDIFPQSKNDLSGILNSTWRAALPWVMQVIFVLLSWVLAILLIKKKKYGLGSVIFAILALLFVFSVTRFREGGLGLESEVILLEDYSPKKGQNSHYPDAFKAELSAGSVGFLVRSESGWAHIRWGEKTHGWVPLKYVGVVQDF